MLLIEVICLSYLIKKTVPVRRKAITFFKSADKPTYTPHKIPHKNWLLTNVSCYQKRNFNLATHTARPIFYWRDINEVCTNLLQKHITSDWNLLIDSSQRKLKTILLHIAYVKPSIFIVHSIHITEKHDSMDMQAGFTIYYCIYTNETLVLIQIVEYIKHDWLLLSTYVPQISRLQSVSLVNYVKICLSFLYIKLRFLIAC